MGLFSEIKTILEIDLSEWPVVFCLTERLTIEQLSS